jgi:hypothetical protein
MYQPKLDEARINFRKNKLRDNKYWHLGIALHFFEYDKIKWKEWFYYFEEYVAKLGHRLHLVSVNGANYGYSTYTKTYKRTKAKLEKDDRMLRSGV